MGLFDQIAGALGQQQGGPGQNKPIDTHPGGLQGLLQQLSQAGLAQQAQSWVSNGNNLPVLDEQITQALGAGKLQDIAQQLGLNHADAASGLAQLLPHVVDHMTPDGAVQDDVVQQGLGLLKGKLFG